MGRTLKVAAWQAPLAVREPGEVAARLGQVVVGDAFLRLWESE